MLAHSRAYVDQLRTRVDEAGSSVECLTAIDASEDEATGGGGGGGGIGFCSYFVLGVRSSGSCWLVIIGRKAGISPVHWSTIGVLLEYTIGVYLLP